MFRGRRILLFALERKEGLFLRLLLTLLALLTGLATADRAVAAPAAPAAMGSLVLLAETVGQADSNDSDHRPVTTTPTRRASSGTSRKTRKAPPPHLPGVLTGSDRALE
jgi:hypothetical protein